MKKFILGLILFVFFFLSGGVNDSVAKTYPQMGISYEQALTQKKKFLLLFYTESCYYCVKFMPNFQKLVRDFGDKYNFVMINANDMRYLYLFKGYEVDAIPCLMMLNPSTNKAEKVPRGYYLNYSALSELISNF